MVIIEEFLKVLRELGLGVRIVFVVKFCVLDFVVVVNGF